MGSGSNGGIAGRALALAAAAALAACGGGAKEGPTPPAPPATYLFHVDDLVAGASSVLLALDPRDASTLVVDTAPGAIRGPLLVRAGRYSAGRVTGAHTGALVYWKSDDEGGTDTLRRVDAVLGPTAPAPARVSSLALPAAERCSTEVYPDYADAARSAVVVRTGGADGSCSTAEDDEAVVVRLGMEAADPPLSSVGAVVLAPLHAADGAISGWLTDRGGELHLDPVTLATGTAVHSGAATVLAYGTSRVWLDVGGALKHVAQGASGLADPGGIPTPLPPGALVLADDTHLYVVETTAGGAIRRLPRDGSAAPTLVHALAEPEAVASALLSAGRIVFREATSGAFRSVPKAGGAEAELFWPTAEAVSAFSAGPTVYVSTGNGSAVSAREDGATGFLEYATTVSTARFTYLASSSFHAGGGAEAGTVIVVEDHGAEQTLRALDGPSRALGPTLGTISGYAASSTAALAEASGTATLVRSEKGEGTDLFFVDTARAGSLAPLATSPDRSETFVGTQGCSSAGGVAPAPALLAVVAAAGLRRRRRQSSDQLG